MIEPLRWDSEHFGFPIARATPDVTSAEVAAADQEGVRCLYLLTGAGDQPGIAAAEELGFRVVDIRVTLARPAESEAGERPPAAIRPCESGDLPALETLAEAAHEDSRFYSDPGFDRASAGRLYRRWIRASAVDGFADLVLVADDGTGACGYITGKRDGGGVVHIGLLAVSESRRGRGVGRALVGALAGAAHDLGAHTVSVVTQGRNTTSQRLYQGCGFRTTDTQLWLHRWAPPAPELR